MPTTRVVNIDILTGKEIQRVYFDPTRAIGVIIPDDDWLGDHLFVPASIVGHDEKHDTLSLKVPDGVVYKVPRNSVSYINPQDDEGVYDILKLHKFSEMSLVYTLRVRYNRDEVYTFVGPILIAINPYKWLADLYSEDTMNEYHTNKPVRYYRMEYAVIYFLSCVVLQATEKKPHLFHIAEAAFVSLMTNSKMQKRNQSIIISGESGAGKTESTKVIMAYLARITTMDRCTANEAKSIGLLEQKVLNTNPILEAFGNAKTLRNDNSSRFGKVRIINFIVTINDILQLVGHVDYQFIKIEFENTGRIIGASIEKYLLEKTRVIHQILGERNFHVFYQLLRGATPEVQAALHVNPADLSVENFKYLLNSTEASFIDHVSDETEFGITQSCMSSVGLVSDVQDDIFKLLLAVLHLGNVNFEEDEEGTVCGVSTEDMSSFVKASSLMGINEADLLNVISKRNMHVNGSIIVKNQTLDQARDKKDSFSKSIYSMLFGWLVEKINITIAPNSHRNLGYIGVLDIYGFENFEGANGFEQLLINYANEKLQNHFNKHIFLVEQTEYDMENIDWSYVKFKDNQMCVDLIEGRPLGRAGVFQTLDDALATGGNMSKKKDANVSFLMQLNNNWSLGKHPNFLTPRFNVDQKFGILHYAGEVFYEIENFTEKNRDSMNADMKSLLGTSTNAVLKEMAEFAVRYDAAITAAVASTTSTSPASSVNDSSNSSVGSSMSRGRTRSNSGRRPSGSVSKLKEQSISKQFCYSLRNLYDILDSTQPHFVRCIKPNNYKRADHMDAFKTLTQLQYAGMMETIRIRKQGYALREYHQEFFNRFSPLEPSCRNLQSLVTKLSANLSASAESWQVGTTKIFLRSDMQEKLERLLALRYSSCVRIIQKFWQRTIQIKASVVINSRIRGYLARIRFFKCFQSILLFQTTSRRFLALKLYKRRIFSVHMIQKYARGHIARRFTKKLRNPYLKCTCEDILAAIEAANAELDEALSSKQFFLCEGIQNRIKDMELALSLNSDPDAEPESRRALELQLLEEEYRLENALLLGSGNAECLKIKDRMNRLNELKEMLPTVEEVRARKAKVDKEMEVAVAAKNFKRCAEVQKDVDSILEQMEEVLLREGPGLPSSYEEFKQELERLNRTFQEEVDRKNFSQCERIQNEIDLLKAYDLSPEEFIKKIDDLQSAFESAKSQSKFAEMAALSYELQIFRSLSVGLVSVTDHVSSSESVDVKSTTIYDDKSVTELKSLLSSEEKALEVSLSEKKYSACEHHQNIIKEVKSAIDRKPYPERNLSRGEIEQLLVERKLLLKEALDKKCYSDMATIDASIEELNGLLSRLPSPQSLQAKIQKLEKDLEEAIRNKDYKCCEAIEYNLAAAKADFEQLKPVSTKRPEILKGPPLSAATCGAQVRAVSSSASKAIKSSNSNVLPHTPSPLTGITPQTVALHNVKSKKSHDSKSCVRPVSKLRPKPPPTLSDRATILEVAELMSSKRADALLLVNKRGALTGIITDNDMTRRVVSKGVQFDCQAKSVMTKQPKCVNSEDPALDALELMVENRFRHLPVLDKNGAVVGLLDIAKCLYDAISALEKVQTEDDDSAVSSEALAGLMTGAMQKAAGGRGGNKAQLAAMQAIISQMFGGSVPTLRTIIGDSEFVSVSPRATVFEASKAMAEVRKGVLVMDDDDLAGIFTPKDLLNRVIAKGLSPRDIVVSDVMTPNPDCVGPDLTLLDALREMHDQKYLHLPVRDDNGNVLGLVDVMELVCHTAGGDDEGGKGWRDFFSSAMNARGDDGSETSSIHARSRGSVKMSAPSVQSRPVSKLRPRVPLTVSDSASVFEVTEYMAAKRVDAALLVNARGELSGIMTDNDLTRRVVSQDINVSVCVKGVMTKQPKCVNSEDPALDALELMVENRFRHLPVLDKNGAVVGLLDIAKCLYDAISALEKVQTEDDDSAVSSEALAGLMTGAMQKAAGGRGGNKAQLAAMQAMISQMFGGSVPTLRTIIGDSEFVSVSPRATVFEASKAMAEVRKGVLVMDDDDLAGIFTPKDLLNRVIAKGLSPRDIVVSDVMTPNPDCVGPDLTLLDALREMHDQKYLHLPVRDDNGNVLGLVDVMELVCHTAGGDDEGGKGWRDFFSSAMNARGDDGSETSSIHSGHGGLRPRAQSRGSVKMSVSSVQSRPVSKLRPKVPLTVSDSASVFEVTEYMAAKRVDAALLVNARGELSGIMTDNDLTRRVVSQDINVSVCVKGVMTKQPKCVNSEDPALDALELMVENRFRHLPVLDKNGAVVGLLDIAKCLYDAISALEKVQTEDDDSAVSSEALAGLMTGAMQKAAGGRGGNKAQLAAMQAMISQMFGGSVPTLLTIIGDSEFVSVSPRATVFEASKAMAEVRKGVLVMDDDDLAGIFTPKDLLNRVIAKGLPPRDIVVSDVMTPNPDCVGPDLTLLDALREMHDQKYLHLPVRDDNGNVLGLVDVMELVCHTAGGDDEGGKGWRDFFSSAMNARGDDGSETSSIHSGHGGLRPRAQSRGSVKMSVSSVQSRPVSKLRPKVPLTVSDSASVFEVTEYMAAKRVDAALLVNARGELSGIMTDNDLTRRVVSQDINVSVCVKGVMTKQPKCVNSEDPALDALELMVENRFRHLPVLDKNGAVVGLLDIAKCLYDAISALEKVQTEDDDSAVSSEALAGLMTGAMQKAAGGRGGNKAQLAAMQAMISQMFGGSVPTLRTIIGDSEFVSVSPRATVFEASKAMAEVRKGVLVMDDDDLAGIFTPKDLLNRVIAKGLPPRDIVVSDVMTPNPDCVGPDLTLLDALREMHDQKYLHLPVRDDNGNVLGLVDVMELVCHTAGGDDEGGKGWRDFFSSAMNARGDDGSETSSIHSGHGGLRPRAQSRGSVKMSVSSVQSRPVSKLRPKVPLTVSDSASVFEVTEYMAAKRVDAALLVNARGELSGIMTDNDLTRRVVSQDINVSVCVKGVMTKQPKCVNSEDPALDALELMVENRFRHLPVLDKNGAVVGLLDIAKCLYDAISALEKVQTEDDDSAVSSEALAGLMTGAMQKAAGGRGGNKAQLAAMQAMISQMFGGSVPTLRTIIGDSEFVSVSPRATVFEASKAMAEVRKGVLVMDDDDLAGIFTPKDLLNRVIAKGLPPRDIVVSDVMTPNPDCVGPDLTLLDALREMHDQKYLHLPVRDDNGNVLGLVDVMELVCHTAGGDDEGGKGWRDFFSSAMNARGDDGSETSSIHSGHGGLRPRAQSRGSVKMSVSSVQSRPVSKLRPKVPLTVSDSASVVRGDGVYGSEAC